MDYHRILEKKKIYDAGKSTIDAITISSYEKDFELTFTHNSTAIEGNTLTLIEHQIHNSCHILDIQKFLG